MRIGETEEERLVRLAKYRVCQERGHKTAYGLGATTLICERCGVHYEYVVKEDKTTLPTGRNRMIQGTNMSVWEECPVEVVFP